jgi:hypothetical protein
VGGSESEGLGDPIGLACELGEREMAVRVDHAQRLDGSHVARRAMLVPRYHDAGHRKNTEGPDLAARAFGSFKRTHCSGVTPSGAMGNGA